MKSVIFFLTALLHITVCGHAQTTVELPIVFQAGSSQSYTLVVGVDSRATACLDSALGEVDLPPFPPDFFPVLLPGCIDTNSETPIMLHRDFRPITSATFSYSYFVRLTRGPEGADAIIRWNKNLPTSIDSAFVQIVFGDTINMAHQEQYIITNDFTRQLYIKVYYSIPTVGVGEALPAGIQPAVLPHPVEETAMLATGDYKGGAYEIYTVAGERVQAGAIAEQESMLLPVEKLAPGVYMLYLKSASGASSFRHFVKK